MSVVCVHPTLSSDVCARPPAQDLSAATAYMLEDDTWSDPEFLAAIWSDMGTDGLEGGNAGWNMNSMATDHQSVSATSGMHAQPAAQSQAGPSRGPACFDVRASDGAPLPQRPIRPTATSLQLANPAIQQYAFSLYTLVASSEDYTATPPV